MAFSSENPVAVVIDAETVSAPDAVGAIAALAEKFPPLILHAFGDFRMSELRGWCDVLDEFGGQALQVTPTEGHDNSVHICLTMNVMEILHGGRASAICIFCGTGDFSQLAVRVRKSGLPVFGFGTAESGETMAPWFDSWQNIDVDYAVDDELEALDEAVELQPETDSVVAGPAAVAKDEIAADEKVDRLAGFRPIFSQPASRQAEERPAEVAVDVADQIDDQLDDIDVMAAIEGKSGGKIAKIRNAPPLSDENLNGKLTEDATLLLSNFITDNLNGNGYALLSDVAHAATAASLLVPPEEKAHPDEYLKRLIADDGRFEITALAEGDGKSEFIRRI